MDLRQPQLLLASIAVALVLGAGAAGAAPSEGQKLVDAQCLTCHEVKGGGDFGNVGPSLMDFKASHPDRKDVVAVIFDETKRNPQTVMPPFGRNRIIDEKEIEAIVDFLYTQ